MKKRNWTRMTVCGALVLGFIIFGAIEVSAARLRFHLDCEKTTEMSEDEVYFVITTKKSDGTVDSIRLPNSGHWSTNDKKNPNDDIHVDLIKFADLKEGESMVVIVAIMEEDDNLAVRDWFKFSEKLGEKIPAAKLGTKVTNILEIITSVIPVIENTDDYIGSFRVDLSYRESDGYTVAEWSGVERSSAPLGQCAGSRSNCFRFNGDGTNYLGWGEIFLKND